MSHVFLLSGCGRMGAKHAGLIAETGQLAGVYDTDPAQAAALGKAHGVPSFSSFEEMLSAGTGADYLSVCSPNGWHAEQIIKGLQAGLNVVCEKPLCLTPAAAWQILETEKFTRRKLLVVKSTRHHPMLQVIRKAIEEATFGPLYSFTLQCLWQRLPEYFNGWKGKEFPDGGPLYTQFSHYLDALIAIGGPLREATGFRTNRAHRDTIEGEDTGAAALVLESGAVGTLHWSVNTSEKNQEIALNLVAQNATLRIGGQYLDKLEYYRGPQALGEALKAAPPIPDHHREIYRQIQEGTAAGLAGTFEGLRTVEAIDLIYRSLPLRQ